MFIFIRLYLAHVISDFLLQTNKIYSLKLKGFIGITPHILIVTLCMIALSWPFLGSPMMWAFIIFIGLTHHIQDWAKIKFNNPSMDFWGYCIDQTLHLTFIALIFLTPLKRLSPLPTNGLLLALYNNNLLCVYSISLVLATYNGFFLILSFNKTFLYSSFDFTVFEKWYGMAERFLVVTLFLFGFKLSLLLCLPIGWILRMVIYDHLEKTDCVRFQFVSPFQVISSIIIALVFGSPLLLISTP